MARTVLTLAADQASDCRSGLTAEDHPLTFVLLLIDHGARQRRESTLRRQRRQFRQRRPRLMPV
ncbi:MAG: hypothetical protein D6740_01025 [Alphaproteobacteria bacterium]|nr:MAG: hypothetical protein D6740_01025 [Alphaproteobacteria bacterium]